MNLQLGYAIKFWMYLKREAWIKRNIIFIFMQ